MLFSHAVLSTVLLESGLREHPARAMAIPHPPIRKNALRVEDMAIVYLEELGVPPIDSIARSVTFTNSDRITGYPEVSRDFSFRVADHPGVGPAMTRSGFVSTNPKSQLLDCRHPPVTGDVDAQIYDIGTSRSCGWPEGRQCIREKQPRYFQLETGRLLPLTGAPAV